MTRDDKVKLLDKARSNMNDCVSYIYTTISAENRILYLNKASQWAGIGGFLLADLNS